MPRRLRAKRLPQVGQGVADAAAFAPGRGETLTRRARVLVRLVLLLPWLLIGIVVQGALLALPGRGKVAFPRVFWSGVARVVGIRLRVVGRIASRRGRPVVFVSNHSSWLDIAALGARLDACFIAKNEVASWPVIGLVAKLGRTVYVRRSKATTGRERDDMTTRLASGDNLILFPEGTTSNGSRVLPFRSAFLSIAETSGGITPLVQPVSIVYDRLGYLPMGRANRPLFAWFGDMDIGSHFWRLAQHRGMRATILLHPPLDPLDYPNRKVLTQAVYGIVAEGAATLRQNRPARPVKAPPPARPSARPAFA